MRAHARLRFVLPILLGPCAVALSSHPVLSQLRDRGPLVLELPASTRALAMGGAFPLGDQNLGAIFHHPGVLSQSRGFEASLQRFGPNSTLASFSAGQSWLSGGVALGVQTLTYGAPATPPVGGDDVLALPADEGSLRQDGPVAASEVVFSAGYGRRVMGVQTGVVGKLIQQRFGPLRASTAAADLGVSFSPGPLTVGLAAQNLGPGLTLGGREVPLPVRFTLGAFSRRAPLGPLDLAAAGAVTYRLDGDVVPQGGVEVTYWPVTGRTFVGWVGYRHLPAERSALPLTLGAGFFGDNIVLEYSFQGFESGDPSHSFGIGWR